MDLLFPNQTALYRRSLESSDEELYQRHLQTTDDNTGTSNAGIPEPCAEPFIPSAGTPADFDGAVSCSADICGSVCRGNDAQLRKDCGCVKCEKCGILDNCPALNGLQVMETYYPEFGQKYFGKCNVIDKFASQVFGEIFGTGRTFRDNPQCQFIVKQYLCLFWGSHNYMYTNYCEKQEFYSQLAKDEKKAPRKPCRSFCVQIVTTCSNIPELIQTCNAIPCEDCEPDPKIDEQPLDALLFCKVPYDWNPYFKASAPTLSYRDSLLLGTLSTLVLSTLLVLG